MKRKKKVFPIWEQILHSITISVVPWQEEGHETTKCHNGCVLITLIFEWTMPPQFWMFPPTITRQPLPLDVKGPTRWSITIVSSAGMSYSPAQASDWPVPSHALSHPAARKPWHAVHSYAVTFPAVWSNTGKKNGLKAHKKSIWDIITMKKQFSRSKAFSQKTGWIT